MIEARPPLLADAPPLTLAAGPHALLDVAVRPLCRGLALAAALSLPVLAPFAADLIPGGAGAKPMRAAVAPPLPPAGGAAARQALLVRGTAR